MRGRPRDQPWWITVEAMIGALYLIGMAISLLVVRASGTRATTRLQFPCIPAGAGRDRLVTPAHRRPRDAMDMNTSRESISVRLRRSARSLGPFEYAATLVLLAVYVIGTSMDEGPDTSMDFYRAVAGATESEPQNSCLQPP
jgi:hypothetical protein